MDVTWTDFDLRNAPLAAEESIRKAEAQLGVRFPPDFVEVARRHQGAAPTPAAFPLADGSSSVFNNLLHFEKSPQATNIVNTRLDLEHLLPEGVIPFGVDPGGNYLCFDYRTSPDRPAVVFWAHDMPGGDTQRIAASFSELLQKLHD